MSTKKSGLGRGLAALLDTTPIDHEQNNNPIKDATSAANSVMDNIVHTGMVAQISLNQIISFDNVHRNIIFVFIGNDIGLEIQHNRIITLPPIAEDLKIDTDQYKYCGHGGALYIVLPRFYAGKREEFILNAYPAYKRFKHSNLSNYYELFIAN